MADVATPEFLSQMKSLYPEKPAGELSPWSFIVAAAFSASNMPEAVPLVYMYASEGLSTDEERLALLRRMKDAVFKSGMLSGYPKVQSYGIQSYILSHSLFVGHQCSWSTARHCAQQSSRCCTFTVSHC